MTATDKLEKKSTPAQHDVSASTDHRPWDTTGTDTTGTVEVTATTQDQPKTRSARFGRRAVIVSALTAVLLTGSAILASVLYFVNYRADQRVNGTVQSEVLSAATDGAAAVLTYRPDTLDADFANAESRLTGDFLNYYSGFTEQVVAPAAKDKAVETEATVMGTAITRIDPSSATVLVFINQTTTSRDTPDPTMTTSSIRLGMQNVDGRWLISSFDPV
ncbi:MAG: hypothetical protein WAW17_08300 [Rhodococcus sp. (in: high G+C Gram-positive bacteria)]|uniref:hypothetical protein n=1 Tax=Rhodococcus sp. TaxID=1831 RepID=UPI003BAF42A6